MIDVAKIKIKAGNGGDGKVSFRREKFIAKGGPDGGDGGKGGDVHIVADSNMATLLDFRAKPSYEGESGQPGGKKKMYGADGKDLVIKVPVGTLIYEIVKNREILVADLIVEGQQIQIGKGGIGGKGNFRFRSSTNQTPMQYTPGEKGTEKEIKLEVKIVADVGLVGAPNAGKSTLLNKLTNSNAKVADYPFTTLSPNLGVYRYSSSKSIVIADIPGLIEGASLGKGLGDDFLRHIERTGLIIHLIDPLNKLTNDELPSDLVRESWNNYNIIRKELEVYGRGLLDKTEIIVINKVDVTEVKESLEKIKNMFGKKDKKVFGISAVSGEGLDELMKEVLYLIDKNPKNIAFETVEPIKIYNIGNLPNKRIVFGTRKVLTKEGKPN